MRTKYLFRAYYITYLLAETQRQAEEWKNFIVENREGFRCALTRDCGPGEAASEITRSRTLHVIGWS